MLNQPFSENDEAVNTGTMNNELGFFIPHSSFQKGGLALNALRRLYQAGA
jgi:hypothetical protein